MSATLMGAAFDMPLPAGEKLLLVALADGVGDDGAGVWPRSDRLAQRTSGSVHELLLLLGALEDRGLLIRVAGWGGHPADFVLNVDRIYAAAETATARFAALADEGVGDR